MYKTGHTLSHDAFQSCSQVTCVDCGEVFSVDDPHTKEEIMHGLCMMPRTPKPVPVVYSVLGKRL